MPRLWTYAASFRDGNAIADLVGESIQRARRLLLRGIPARALEHVDAMRDDLQQSGVEPTEEQSRLFEDEAEKAAWNRPELPLKDKSVTQWGAAADGKRPSGRRTVSIRSCATSNVRTPAAKSSRSITSLTRRRASSCGRATRSSARRPRPCPLWSAARRGAGACMHTEY